MGIKLKGLSWPPSELEPELPRLPRLLQLLHLRVSYASYASITSYTPYVSYASYTYANPTPPTPPTLPTPPPTSPTPLTPTKAAMASPREFLQQLRDYVENHPDTEANVNTDTDCGICMEPFFLPFRWSPQCSHSFCLD
ncbi:hypothetical protein BDBG_16878 [Blastomyces gilchristii SLH14081]|uniref:Uncharacterized protein n=1 Tax=Blastomyces gilchristii (strain SLH14081) TaxID=559298 RepID=A0A179UIR1_BLAGS|nr:uncharacterized protein BDBG_16878 [Blastomyces gilchristii SLH14081]OAT07653.1 hypothetical protein BDBG_16878 [Blastomyces gilchristii SLH14081]